MMEQEEFEKSNAPQTRHIRLGTVQKRILKLLKDREMAMRQNEIARTLNQEYDDADYGGPQIRQSVMRMVSRDDIPVERKDIPGAGIHYGISDWSKVNKMYGKHIGGEEE